MTALLVALVVWAVVSLPVGILVGRLAYRHPPGPGGPPR